jgi:adenine-specific DNA-methyltransferase
MLWDGVLAPADIQVHRRAAVVLADGEQPGERLAFARAYCHAAIVSYWQETLVRQGNLAANGAATAPLPYMLPLPALAEETRRSAIRTGREAASLPGDLASYRLGSIYAAMMPHDLRAANGIYFTPPSVAERLLDLVTSAGFDWRHGTVLDPAAGGGAFLAPVAERMLAYRQCGDSRSEDITSRLFGIELDPFLAWAAQVFVNAALVLAGEQPANGKHGVVITGSALGMPYPTSGDYYDLVIGNPPYGRVSLDPGLRHRYSSSLHGHANLYGLFTHLATKLVRPGGLVAFVTPTSFLGGQYFKNLRRMLLSSAPPISIDFVADRSGVFEDVLQETMLVVFRAHDRPGTISISSIRPTSPSDACQVTQVGRVECPLSGCQPWLLPRGCESHALVQSASSMHTRLSHYGYAVSTGPLVWNRHKEQLRSAPSKQCYPLIWAESVRSEGVFRFQADKQNHEPYFEVGPKQAHLLLKTPCLLVQRTTAKEQPHRLVAACLPESFLTEHGAVVVENHLNVITSPNRAPIVSLETIEALLNSDVVDTLFRSINGSVAVSAYELEELPFPDLSAVAQLQAVVEGGASPTAIESTIRELYGVAD